MKYPVFTFDKWLTDPNLQSCSPATKGIWLYIVFAASELGLEIVATRQQLAQLCRCLPEEIDPAMKEIDGRVAGVSVNDDSYTIRLSLRGYFYKGCVRSAIPESVRSAVLGRDASCALCGSSERLEIDHIKPVAHGGSNHLRNLQVLCRPCNASKGCKLV